VIPSHRFLRNRSTDRTTIKYLFFDDLLSSVRNPEETRTNRKRERKVWRINEAYYWYKFIAKSITM